MSDLNCLQKRAIKAILENIRLCKEVFSNLQELSLNIPMSIKFDLKNILERQTKWVELMHANYNPILEYINKKFYPLLKWLLDWKELESKNKGANQDNLKSLQSILNNTKIAILSVLLFKKSKKFTQNPQTNLNTSNNHFQNAMNELEIFTQKVFTAYKNTKFEDLIMHAKIEYFKLNGWNKSWNMHSNEFLIKFNKHLYLFFADGINDIFWEEIKNSLGLYNLIMHKDLKKIFNYFFSSLEKLETVINKKYVYDLISSGLENNGITFESLVKSRNQILENRDLCLIQCPFPQYLNKRYELSYYGLQDSMRFEGDHLIILGKDDSHYFTSYIALPNLKGLDSIIAFIFVNAYGYNLVDISRDGCVHMKLEAGGEIEIKDGMIIVFGRGGAFGASLSKQGMMINGQKVNDLTLNGIKTCPNTANFIDIRASNNTLTIGRGENNTIILPFQDISDRHAECYLKNGVWFLRDCISVNGTFYKLKLKRQIEEEEPSDFITLKDFQVFTTGPFTFILLPPIDYD
ncbi:hypothetical protein SteCoe_2333 [Stentor coeruleus]|uniref:FHA domain-containing protein n=1 Tax=Stentor coeruleus TaxID=5963 RepID=A0A1R2CZL3_9CILI|nr:hypothetical protein SteCoe_2333 [Stentor coeruleus]